MLVAICSIVAALRLRMLRRQDQLTHSTEIDRAHADLAGSAATLVQINAEYHALLSGCGSGVFVLDSNDAIERASPEACRLLGLQQKQLEGKSLLQATLSSDLQTCGKAGARTEQCAAVRNQSSRP